MSKNKLISMKRIERDITEITKNPMKGIGIVKYEDDFMKYIVNIKLLNGIYEGYCLQLLLTFSEYYPVKPPKILIFPNQQFGNSYHHHIFYDKDGFKKFCFDLLDNDFMNINEVNTGWNPSYTISSLLLQVQNFLSDPDLPSLPSQSQIEYLFNSMKKYVKIFFDESGNEIVHTWENPYPPMFGFEPKEKEKEKEIIKEEEEKNDIIKDSSDDKIENRNGNKVTNFLSYVGSFIPFFSIFTKNDDNNESNTNLKEEKAKKEEEEEEEKLEGEIEKEGEEEVVKEKEKRIEEEKEDIDENINQNNIRGKKEIKHEKENIKNIIEEDKKDKKDEKEKIEIEKKIEEEKQKEKERKKRIEEIKQNLSCFVLRVNIIDDKDICLGYPLKQLVALGDKIECVPIPEILSYEGYISQIAKQDGKLDDYFNVSFKAANNEYYNYWLPIYINEDHFQRNKTLILNSFSVLKFGAGGRKEYDFKPDHIFEYLPNLLNKMICGMFNEKSYMSEAYIRCYFQYLLLFRKLIDEFKDDFHKYLNEILDLIKKYNYVINKTIVPDLGNLFMLLYFSDTEIDKKIWNVLFEEKMIRKMYWTFHYIDHEPKCKSIFDSYDIIDIETNQKLLSLMKKENLIYYEFLEEFKGDKIYQPDRKECKFTIYHRNLDNKNNATPLKGLFAECIEKGIFDKIINIIAKELMKKPKKLNDLFAKKEKKVKIDENMKNEVKSRIIDGFPSLYKNVCSPLSQNKIDKLLMENIDLYKYFSDELKTDDLKKKDYFEINQVDELLQKIDKKYHLDIVNKLYEVSKDNLLLITTLAQMKMNEQGFLEELENNYGLYMNIEDFMKEINQKIKDIKCYKDLFDFMKADVVFKVEDEYETIIKSYQRAKEKKYIQTIYVKSSNNYILRNADDFKFNRSKNSNTQINSQNNNNINRINEPNRNNRNNNNGNNRNIRNNNNINRNNNGHNYHNNERNRRNMNNNIHSNTNANTNRRRKNNFNSHMVDLDELLGE